MNFDVFTGLITFAFATSGTPGPNNLMLMASGTNFGLKRTLPHWLGVSLGLVVLTLAVGFGVNRILQNYPALKIIMQVLCSAYLVWLAWKIATAAKPREGPSKATPLSFLQAAGFQWINPKALAMAVTAISLYAPNSGNSDVILVSCIFGIINFPTVGLWVIAGTKLQNFLQQPQRLRIFNIAMALLLLTSLVPIFM